METGKVAVMGAGAVGCYYGALLAMGGEDVTLIGRDALVAAVTVDGLRLETDGSSRLVRPSVTTGPDGVAGADLVLVTVKAADLEAAGRAIAPYLAPDAVVLALQNGVGHAARLAAVLCRPVVPAVVYAAVSVEGAGRVRHSGGGKLILAEGPGSAMAAHRLSAAGIPVEVTADAGRTLWTKLTVNCVYNALSALSRMPYGPIVAQPGAEQVMRAAMDECRAVADHEGVALPADLWDTVRRIADTMPAQFSSMAQDMQRGRLTEVDFLNGEIVRRAEAAGIAVPVNHTLWVLVNLSQRGGFSTDDGPAETPTL